jgi:hypothetical protein
MKSKIIALVLMILFTSLSVFTSVGNSSLEDNILINYKANKHSNLNVEYWALIIGIGVYANHPEETIPSDLSAEAMYDSLLISDHWQEDHIKIITNEEATKSNIKKGFEWLDNNEDENDILVIYLATHGAQLNLFNIPIDLPPKDETDRCDEFLLTYYSCQYPLFTYIIDDELSRLLDDLESQGICVIIDSCFAGGFKDTQGKAVIKNKIPITEHKNGEYSSKIFINEFLEEINKDGRVILMACQEDEYAFAYPGEGHCFTNILVKSIGEGFGDFNNNGLISAEEAFNYTKIRVGLSKWTPQHPTLVDTYNGELHLTDARYKTDYINSCETELGWTTIDHTEGIGGDLWHLSEINYSSPTHCWYLGNEKTMRYNNTMNNSVVSSYITLGEKPLLTVNGQYSKEYFDSIWLDISENNWNSYVSKKLYFSSHRWDSEEILLYSSPFGDLSGKTVNIRFRVVSDVSIPFYPRTGVGFFMIDDIQIYSEWT